MCYGHGGSAGGHRRASLQARHVPNGEPTLVSIPVNAVGSTAIFVGVIPMVMNDDQLEVILGIKAKIARFHPKAKKGVHAKIQIPNGDVDRVLELDLSVSGHKLRVAKWWSFKAPSPASAYATNRWKSEVAMKEQARHHVKSEVAMKEQARFVAEFLHAQAGPNVRRLYSQVASNTAEARMKFMETAMYDMRQMLKRLMKPCQ